MVFLPELIYIFHLIVNLLKRISKIDVWALKTRFTPEQIIELHDAVPQHSALNICH